jgi:transcriptional regulator with XRE-family HTH domain
MNSEANIGKIIQGQRKSIPLSLNQLTRLSGVSVSHLGRIEQGQRQPSTRTLWKIAKHLGFDMYELLVIAGHLLPNQNYNC